MGTHSPFFQEIALPALAALLPITSPVSRIALAEGVGAVVCAVRALFSLKLLLALADIYLVQKFMLIGGLSLALCGATLVGVGEWASGRFSNAEPEGRPSAPAPASSSMPSRVAGMAPLPPALPDTSDHLPANSPGYTFRRDIPEVRVQFTVADQQGRAIRDVASSDVRVYDNQAPVGSFNEFEREDNLPLQVGLLIDTSDSVKRVLPEEKAAAARFLERVLRPQDDTAFVMGVGGEFKLWQAPTADRLALLEAIHCVQEPGWGTRFYDALYSALDERIAVPANGQLQHQALVILSDGDDNQSVHDLRDVMAAAIRSEAQIYALTIRPRKTAARGDGVLQRLAEATGGRVYYARSSKELDGAFAQIEQELRTQYYVSFSPQQATPGFHSLRVEVHAPHALQVHARQGYYALAQ